MPSAWQLTPHEVAGVAVYLRSLGTVPAEVLPGDIACGSRIYQAKGCAGRPMIDGQGGGFGPELSDIGGMTKRCVRRAHDFSDGI